MTLGDVLGTSGMDGQEQTLLQATRQLMQMEQTLQTQSYRKGRLYRSLGILGGMAVALLLW
jgi:stage III sporulation protein AB